MCIGKKRKSQAGKGESGVQNEWIGNMGGSKKQICLLHSFQRSLCLLGGSCIDYFFTKIGTWKV